MNWVQKIQKIINGVNYRSFFFSFLKKIIHSLDSTLFGGIVIFKFTRQDLRFEEEKPRRKDNKWFRKGPVTSCLSSAPLNVCDPGWRMPEPQLCTHSALSTWDLR